MATIQTKKLQDRLKGDTFEAVNFTFTGVDLTGASIRIQFRYRCKTGAIVKDISTGSGITITDATAGKFTIDEFTPIDWEVDTYYYDVPIVFPSGKNKTYLKGTVKINQDTTNPN